MRSSNVPSGSTSLCASFTAATHVQAGKSGLLACSPGRPTWRNLCRPGSFHDGPPSGQKPLDHRAGHAWQDRRGPFRNWWLTGLCSDHPAEMPATYGEAGAHVPLDRRTPADFPARYVVHGLSPVKRQQDKQLDHHSGWHLAPPLLVALNRFFRDAQCHGELGLSAVHDAADPFDRCGLLRWLPVKSVRRAVAGLSRLAVLRRFMILLVFSCPTG